jgi:hypothetical protein
VVNTISWYDSFNWASPRQHKDNTRGIVLDAKARHLFNYEPFPNSQSPIPNLPSPPPTIVSQNVPPSRHHFIQFSPILPIFPPKSTPLCFPKNFPPLRWGGRSDGAPTPVEPQPVPRIPTPVGPQHTPRTTHPDSGRPAARSTQHATRSNIAASPCLWYTGTVAWTTTL